MNLGGTLMPARFFDKIRAEEDPADRPHGVVPRTSPTPPTSKQLFGYCQDGVDSASYNDGNAAFAEGESAMYLQGSYAIPPIRAINPDAGGIFPYPATDNPPTPARLRRRRRHRWAGTRRTEGRRRSSTT